MRGTDGVPIWQRNYYEHIFLDEKDLQSKQITSKPIRFYADEADENQSIWGNNPPHDGESLPEKYGK